MPDNWGFVAAAYAVAAVILGGYWRMLARKERDLLSLSAASRSHPAAVSTPPRPAPGARPPRQP